MTVNREILDLRYFGSTVRLDADGASDVDILCVSNGGNPIEESEVLKLIGSEVLPGQHVDISHYGVSRIREMWKSGHLFAWHIYLESKAVTNHFSFLASLGAPAPYEQGYDDIQRLIHLLDDVGASLARGSESLVFEAGLMYVAARNIGITASWYSERGLNFSRAAPFFIRFNNVDCIPDVTKETYFKLCTSRHASMRGGEVPVLTELDLAATCGRLRNWANRVLGEVEVLS